jgi:hypothetical protein
MSQERKFYFDILSDVRKYNGTLTYAKNTQHIDALPASEAHALICAWLQMVEQSEPIDYEMIRCAAWVCTSVPALDEAVMAWVKFSPSELRHGMAAEFLTGYWAAKGAVSDKCLDFLVDAANNKLGRSSVAYVYTLGALKIVADPALNVNFAEEKKVKLSELLLLHLDYLEKHALHESVAKSLAALRDFELRKYLLIFDQARKRDPSVFKGKKLSEVKSALLKWLEIWTKPGWFDQERMWDAGMLIGNSTSGGIDEYVCEWMSLSPTIERCAVVAAFLGGYWREVDQVSRESAEILRKTMLRFPTGSEANRVAVLALTFADESKGPG